MKFKLFGTNIYVSFLFCAVITLMIATDRTGLIIPTFAAVLFHETGHLFAMWALDCAPKEINLVPASISVTSGFTKSYKSDIAIAVTGPAVNLLLFVIFFINSRIYKNDGTLNFALINFIIFFFNSLPLIGLDGGTAAYCILAKKISANKAVIILKIINLIFALSFLFLAVYLTFSGKMNISLYIMAIYLFITVIIKKSF